MQADTAAMLYGKVVSRITLCAIDPRKRVTGILNEGHSNRRLQAHRFGVTMKNPGAIENVGEMTSICDEASWEAQITRCLHQSLVQLF